jgi:hypothetical protein
MGPSIDTTIAYRRALSPRGRSPNICLGQNFKVEGRIVFGEQSRVGEDCYD